MKINLPPGARERFSRQGFTLVEMMVSTAVLALIMTLLITTVDQTQRIWSRTASKITQFQSARSAFDAMTRNLSQATLNTYYALQVDSVSGDVTGYTRTSDLHFVSGKAYATKLLLDRKITDRTGSKSATAFSYPTHAVFFQAPLAVTSELATAANGSLVRPVKYRQLSNLLTAVGYYVEWSSYEALPHFMQDDKNWPQRYRSRLMEVIQPSEYFGLYNTTTFTKSTDWVKLAVGAYREKTIPLSPDPNIFSGPRDSSRVLAENIVALVILPKRQERTGGNTKSLDLTKNYEYDSRPSDNNGNILPKKSLNTDDLRRFHQLPPIVQVTMVAVDESSAARYQQIKKDEAPTWTDNLFQTATTEDALYKDLGDPSNPDPNSLIYKLSPPDNSNSPTPKMNYRIYTTEVVIRGAKWTSADTSL